MMSIMAPFNNALDTTSPTTASLWMKRFLMRRITAGTLGRAIEEKGCPGASTGSTTDTSSGNTVMSLSVQVIEKWIKFHMINCMYFKTAQKPNPG